MKDRASLIVYLNEAGEVIHVRNVDLSEVEYDKDERDRNRTMIGARIFTPNGCCWRLTPTGWKCLPC